MQHKLLASVAIRHSRPRMSSLRDRSKSATRPWSGRQKSALKYRGDHYHSDGLPRSIHSVQHRGSGISHPIYSVWIRCRAACRGATNYLHRSSRASRQSVFGHSTVSFFFTQYLGRAIFGGVYEKEIHSELYPFLGERHSPLMATLLSSFFSNSRVEFLFIAPLSFSQSSS